MSLAAGTRLGPYEISHPIGSGGMGEVYQARDTRLTRDVAVKGPVAGSSLWTGARLVRVADGAVTALPFEAEFVRSMTVSNDGTKAMTTTADGSLWIYDLIEV